MKYVYQLPVRRSWHALTFLILSLILVVPWNAFGQRNLNTYYANRVIGFSRISGGTLVQNPGNTVDEDKTNFATISRPTLGIGSSRFIDLRMPLSVPAGYRAGFVISQSQSVVDISLLPAITIVTYLGNTEAERVSGANLLELGVLAGSTDPVQLEFITTKPFDRIRLEINYGLLNLNVFGGNFRVHYAYGVERNVLATTNGFLSRFPADLADHYSINDPANPDLISVCLNTGVQNPGNAVDEDLSNFATLQTTLGVSCQTSFKVDLEGTAPAGYYAGFVIGYDGLADVDVLNSITLATYLDGVRLESTNVSNIARLNVLPDGQAFVYFSSTDAFNQVEITVEGLVSVLSTLEVYYGFGLEPLAFSPQVVRRSEFPNPQPNSEYLAFANNTLCVDLGSTPCAIINPNLAADNELESNWAEIDVTASVISSYRLRLRINGSGDGGNRAGVVIGSDAGVLDANALENLTILTYASGVQNARPLESRSGANLLRAQLIPGTNDKYEISFRTTADFDWVEFRVDNAVSILNDLRIYYAFADDEPVLDPDDIVVVPLPVELMAFEGRRADDRVRLTWATASEENNSHFEVERSLTGKSGFEKIGRVKGMGNSQQKINYSFTDAGAFVPQTYYYRLRQVDYDGTAHYSKIVAVQVPSQVSEEALTLYPNPAPSGSEVHLKINLTDGKRLLVYSASGVLVRDFNINARTTMLPLQDLSEGLYLVQLIGQDGRSLSTQRLVVGGARP